MSDQGLHSYRSHLAALASGWLAQGQSPSATSAAANASHDLDEWSAGAVNILLDTPLEITEKSRSLTGALRSLGSTPGGVTDARSIRRSLALHLNLTAYAAVFESMPVSDWTAC